MNSIITINLKRIVLDGSNIAHNFRGNTQPPKLEHILLCVRYFVSKGVIPIVLVDYNLQYIIDDPKGLKVLFDKEIIHQVPKEIHADLLILQVALAENANILSNDLFRDYWDVFGREMIMNKRISFKIIEGKLYLSR